MNQDPKKTVSLEDLLHLKRAERPPEQFWVQFESELRAKQLAAIVQQRPWWSSWERISQRLSRQSLPIGATAVLALGLLSFHEYRARSARSEVLVPLSPSVTPSQMADDSEEVAAQADPAPVAALAPAPARAVAATAPVAEPAKSTAAAVAVAADSGNDPFSALVGSPRKASVPAPLQSDAWSHFGDQQLASNALASNVGFAPHAFSASASEPLAQMSNPVDERRAMLLSGSLPRSDNASFDDSVGPSMDDHSASRLSDERLYESVRRYGLGGNRISVRF